VENITLPVMIAGHRIDRDWLARVVAAVGLTDRLSHRPAELSGGQQQRVAVARALITRPAVIFADEPTGNLDSRSGAEVLRLLRDAVDQLGQTVVMVTHDPLAATRADRVTFLADGRPIHELDRPDAGTILDVMSRLDSVSAGDLHPVR
jgi:putative ABC transport system ATP-binding protein